MYKYLLIILISPILVIAQVGCWNDVFSGRVNSIYLKDDGSTWSTGLNFNGQLGIGNNTTSNVPVNLNISEFIKFAVGDYHVLAIKSDGTLWGWGQNSLGQLGDGSLIDRNIPVQIGTDNNWVEIATGRRHSTAIKSNGTLWTWGFNQEGYIGVGNTNEYLTPVQIGTDTNWSKIAMGYYHSLAIKTDGSLWCWGWNINGQIGDNTTNDRLSPFPIALGQTWIMVKGGNAHSIGIRNDGTLWGWGWNNLGQLGDGTTSNSLIPKQIGTSNNWQSISVGLAHTLALDNNGNLWSCGLNNTGQLGYGIIDNNPNTILNQVPLSFVANKISCGAFHNNIIDSNNNIHSFGLNTSGQFGNGNFISNINATNYINCTFLSSDNQDVSSINFELFPNPTDRYFIIKNKVQNLENFKYQVIDIAGRVVITGNSKFGEKINIESINIGNYIININTEDGDFFIKKLIKN